MRIENLLLTNFRNHKKNDFTFSGGVNLILGPNTSGKSNILEVLYFLAIGHFVKAGLAKNVIAYGEDFCRVDAVVHKRNDIVRLSSSVAMSKETDRAVRTYEVNKIRRAKNRFLGNFYAVLFTPESLDLITDSPSLRREYVDFVLEQTDPRYRTFKPIYDKIVRNRNKVLEKIRDKGAPRAQLEYWNIKILEYGIFIQKRRREFFNFVNSGISDVSKSLGLFGLKVNYLERALSKEKLDDSFLKELRAGATLAGPNRDDFEFLLNGKNLKDFGSRGEQRTAAVSLKMRELDFIKGKVRENPVLLLDDIFSELDKKHRETITNICGNQQTIVTSAEKTLVPSELLEIARTIAL